MYESIFDSAKARISWPQETPNLRQKNQRKRFCTKFLNNPSGHGRPRRKSWTSAPKSAFSCGRGGGEKLFDPWAFGRKGQERPQEIRAKKFLFMLFFLPWTLALVLFSAMCLSQPKGPGHAHQTILTEMVAI